jgi:Beta-galactosidase
MRISLPLGLLYFLLLPWLVCPAVAAETGAELEDFEGGYLPARWTFSNGAEFPGAKGSFKRATEAAHEGKFGGQLTFDFTGGGNYVGAILQMPEGGAGATSGWNGLRLWLKRPEGNDFVFRYSDSAGQTFQKWVECPAGRWVRVTIPFSGWTGHWGGADDGKMRGGPRMLALNVDHGLQTMGALLFDDLRLVNAQEAVARVSYPAYRFGPEEGWHTRAEGNGGASRLEGRTWTPDFSQGARWVSLGVPDHLLLGSVDKIRLRVRGNAKGHPVRLVLHTHFMTFQKTIGEFAGDGEQELVTDGPPGPGWEWYGGENDGKIHGPLRLGEIGLQRGSNNAPCTLELRDLMVDASCPEESRCVLLAEGRGAGNDSIFVAHARALTDTPLNGELQWVLRDWDGNEVGRGTKPVSVPPKAKPAQFTLPITGTERAQRRFLEAEITLNIPGQEVAPVRAAWVAGLNKKGDAALEPESPFGMGVYLNRYGGDAGGLALMERAAQMARDAGVKWSREDFSWGRIERQRGEFDWTYYDNLLACARRNGITVYAIVGYWTGWTKPYTSEGIEDYVQFLKVMVKRYQKQIKQWEIWNEPNIFFWDGPKDLYAQLLTKSYAAIKETDPAAQVLGLSTAGIDQKFISRMLELKAPFDVLTIHPYRTHLNDQAFIEDLKKVSDQVKLPDGKRRPVWLTEMGWATHTPHNTVRQDFAPNTLRAQAELIARSYLCAIVSGVEPRTFWYDFRNDGDDPIYFEHQMGIVYNDFSPKPAYLAYATLTRVLRGKRLVGPVPVPQGVLAFSFKPTAGGSGETIALWSPQADTLVELPTTAQRVARINGIGEESELQVRDGRVNVGLKKGAPVYLGLGSTDK